MQGAPYERCTVDKAAPPGRSCQGDLVVRLAVIIAVNAVRRARVNGDRPACGCQVLGGHAREQGHTSVPEEMGVLSLLLTLPVQRVSQTGREIGSWFRPDASFQTHHKKTACFVLKQAAVA